MIMRNTFSFRHPYLPWLLTVASLLHAGWVCAADEAAELLKLVGSDASLCVEAVGLKDAVPRLRTSELATRVEKSLLFKQWQAGKDYANFVKFYSGVEPLLSDALIQDMFGRAVVLVVYTNDRPRPTGVVLTHAASADVARSVIDLWNANERHQTLSREFAGHTYFTKAKKKRDGSTVETLYYVLFDSIAALSDNEEEIRRVIALRVVGQGGSVAAEVSPRSTESLWKDNSYHAIRESLAEGTTVAAYLNPRHWDAEMQIESGLTAADPVLRSIAGAWRRSKSIAAGLRFEESVVLEVVSHFELQPVLQESAPTPPQTPAAPAFLARIPQQALFAAAGRIDFRPAARMLAEMASATMDRQWMGYRQIARGLCLGLDPVSDILPRLGPNWGAYVVASQEDQATVAPVHAVLAFEISAAANPSASGPSLREGLENALTTGLNFWAAAHNSQGPARPAVVRTENREGLTMKWIDGMDYHQPAFAFAGDYLVLASSPRAVTGFAGHDSSQSLASLPAYQNWSKKFFKDDNQVVFANLSQIRKLLTERQETLATQISIAHRLSGEEIKNRITGWNDLLQILDGAFLAAHVRPDRAHVVIGGALSPRSP